MRRRAASASCHSNAALCRAERHENGRALVYGVCRVGLHDLLDFRVLGRLFVRQPDMERMVDHAAAFSVGWATPMQ